MKLWDYKLSKGWQPKTRHEWLWYLERKINYDDWKGLEGWMLKKYAPSLKLDPGKRLLVRAYVDRYGKTIRIPTHRATKRNSR